MIFFLYELFNKFKDIIVLPPMHGVNQSNSTLFDLSTNYSPVTLNHEWPKVGRLILMATVSSLGTTFNGFFVASFFVECSLQRAGMTFLACIGMADLIITGGVMSISAVILLSGQWDNIYVCNVEQLLGTSATYCYSLFFMFVAVEDYIRLCYSQATYDLFLSWNVSLITISIFLMSFGLGTFGVYFGLDYDYCHRSYSGSTCFRAISTVLFHILPAVLTGFCLISSFHRVRRLALQKVNYRRSEGFGRDYSIALLNIIAYVLYFIAWLPYNITSLDLAGASNAKYYNTIWIGIGRSVFTSFLYSILNRNFRRAFAHLFNYCCCKSSLPRPVVTRHRRKNAREYKTTVRVLHPNMIIAPSVQLQVQSRVASTSRDIHLL